MAAFLKRKRRRNRRRGQTVVEWLLLTALCFVVGYIMITRPIALGTRLMLTTVKSSLGNMIQNGQVRPGNLVDAGNADHPASKGHFKATHN